MKKAFHRVLCLSLVLVLTCSLAVSASAVLAAEESEDIITGGIVSPGLHNFTQVNTYTEGQYTDVPASHTFAENAKAGYEYNIMQGYGSSFGVSNNITRLASIIIACRLHCIYYGGSNNVEKLYSGTTQEIYLAYAKDNDILCDFDNVSQHATRAEFAAILSSAFPDEALPSINTVEEGAIPDVSKNHIYREAIYRLYRAGILNGSDAKGTFYPGSYINRGAACAIATRMCSESLRKSFTLNKEESKENKEITIDFKVEGIGNTYKYYYSNGEYTTCRVDSVSPTVSKVHPDFPYYEINLFFNVTRISSNKEWLYTGCGVDIINEAGEILTTIYISSDANRKGEQDWESVTIQSISLGIEESCTLTLRFRDDERELEPKEEIKFSHVMDKGSKVFHLSTCEEVSKIAEENKATSTSSAMTLYFQGYEPCDVCTPFFPSLSSD